MTTETRPAECTAPASTLFMSLELGSKKWKLAFTTGASHRPRVVQLAAGDLGRVWAEVTRAKGRFGLSADTVVRSCYEAGRDGFWLHRALAAQGVLNVVVDPSSIVVDRRARRAKTDRIDATALVIQLMHATAGDRRGWRELRVPSAQAEADRQLQREWETVCVDRTRIRNRMQGLLATQGITLPHAPFHGATDAGSRRGRPGRVGRIAGAPDARLDPIAAGRGPLADFAPSPSRPRA